MSVDRKSHHCSSSNVRASFSRNHAVFVVAVLGTLQCNRARHESHDLSRYVNTARGSDNEILGFSYGNTVPAAAWPHGFNLWTPITDASTSGWIYRYSERAIEAFAASHIASPWIADYAQLQFFPQMGALVSDPDLRRADFDHADEVAKGHYYSVEFDNGIRTEMTPTLHGAVVRITYPSEATTARVLFESGDGATGTFAVDDSGRVVRGTIEDRRPMVPRLYFYAVFDTDVATPSTQPTCPRGCTSAELRWASGQRVATFSIATSFISQAQAQDNWRQELSEVTFQQAFERAASEWDRVLGKIELIGASEDEKTTFYSCLYRVFVYPNAFWESVGGVKKYFSPYDTRVHEGTLYVNNGFWDTYKNAWPLYVLLTPTTTGDMLNGLVDTYKQGGAVPRWIAPGYRDAMVSSHTDVVFADAYLKGVTNFDYRTAYESAIKNATVYSDDPAKGRKGTEAALFLGYTPHDVQPESASWSLENALCDAGIARFARALGRKEDADYFSNRARWYANLFSPYVATGATVGGFFRGRLSDGAWRTTDADFAPAEWGHEFTEGCAWQYRFHPAHDLQGLANLLGGRGMLERAIDETFAYSSASTPGSYGLRIHEMDEAAASGTGQYNPGNQPDHFMIYSYHYAGAPAKAALRARDIMTRLYGPGHDGRGYLGDDDNGSMSAWYVFSAIGLFPAQGAVDQYLIGTPLFRRVIVHLENGRDFVIDAPNTSRTNLYVQRASLNGVPQQDSFITHRDIVEGGRLELAMGSTPSSWGTGADDVPSSLTVGQRPPAPLADCSRGAKVTTDAESRDSRRLSANAIDDSSLTSWLAATPTPWLQIELRTPKVVHMYTLTSGADVSRRDPSRWVLWGSNDGAGWISLDVRDDQSFAWRHQTRSFTVDAPQAYRYFRLEVKANHGDVVTQLAELELIGDP